MKKVYATCLCCIGISASPLIGQSLPDTARQHGGAASKVIDVDSPISHPAEVLALADLVVHGRVTAVKTRLNSDESNVITEYTITPIQAFKDRRGTSVRTPGVVAEIVVQRYGGRLVTATGLRLSTSVNVFPEEECFGLGEDVVVFLTYNAESRTYSFAAGEFSAFRIREGKVSPMTKGVAARRLAEPVDAPLFFRDLQRTR